MSETANSSPDDRGVPVIDFSCYSIDIPDTEAEGLLLSFDRKVTSLAGQLTRALEENGCAILVNHGIGRSTIKYLRDEGMLFFQSPAEYKNKFVTDFIHGYIRPGLERCELIDAPMTPDIEGFFVQIGPAFDTTLADGLYEVRCRTNTGITQRMRVRSIVYSFRNWPDDKFPSLRNAFNEWQKVTNRLGGRVVDLLSRGLGFQDPLYMRSNHCDLERNAHCYRLNYYPPQAEDKECQVGLERFCEHKDYDTITMVATTGPGLQSRQRDGTWIDVPVIEDGIFIHGGTALQEYSSDKILPDYHRVVMPPAPACYKERFSMLTFFCPHPDALLESLDGSGTYKPHLAGEIGQNAYDAIFRPKNK